MSNEKVQLITHQIQVAEEQRVHDNGVEMRTTKQDGDEDSFESTEVSAWKTTESRNEVQKVSEKTLSQNHQQKERARSHNNTKYGIKRAESDERTIQSR